MQACADSVGLQKGGLYHYVKDKVDLAHQVLSHMTARATNLIYQKQGLSCDTIPMPLTVVPMQLWPASPELQAAIQSYYQDWYIAFLNQAMSMVSSHASHHKVIRRVAKTQFLMWLGLGFCAVFASICARGR